MYDHQEYTDYVKKKRPGAADPTRVRLALQAAVDSENLTHDPLWDRYLSVIQGAIEQSRADLEEKLDHISYPQHLPDDHLRVLMSRIHTLSAHIDALEWAITLTAQMLDNVKDVEFNFDPD